MHVAAAPPSANWEQAFGANADEYFNAWAVARYVGRWPKRERPFIRCPWWPTRPCATRLHPGPAGLPGAPGAYESGGPTDNVLGIWKAAAPAIDVLGPDDYQNNPAAYVKALELYRRSDNPLFCPRPAARLRPLLLHGAWPGDHRILARHRCNHASSLGRASRNPGRAGWQPGRVGTIQAGGGVPEFLGNELPPDRSHAARDRPAEFRRQAPGRGGRRGQGNRDFVFRKLECRSHVWNVAPSQPVRRESQAGRAHSGGPTCGQPIPGDRILLQDRLPSRRHGAAKEVEARRSGNRRNPSALVEGVWQHRQFSAWSR